MNEALRACIPICDAVAALFHPHVEVVLHDLASGSIAHIANAYSKRRPGDSSLTESEAAFDLDQAVIGPYPKTNWDGRRLKSITAVIRGPRGGRPIGLLCINHDVEALAGLIRQLSDFATLPGAGAQPAALFAADWQEAINAAIGEALAARNRSIAGLDAADIDALIAALDQRGVFQIRRAVPYVADVLRLSRATIYKRLGAIRQAGAEPMRKTG